MNPHRRTKLSAASSRRKLRVATGATGETFGHRMSRWWHRGVRKSSLNAIIGIFLLPLAWLLSQTFFTAFRQDVVNHELWRADEFGFFLVGALGWTLAFLAGLRITGSAWPLHVYVFGHELTHAVWVWLCNGRVLEKKMWADDGGYIVTDTNNFWIALTPYFYPFYSLVVIVFGQHQRSSVGLRALAHVVNATGHQGQARCVAVKNHAWRFFHARVEEQRVALRQPLQQRRAVRQGTHQGDRLG